MPPGRQKVDNTAKTSRYDRGVGKLDPAKRLAIETVLRDEPTLSKSEIARRVGMSRSSVGYYLRGMRETLAAADAKAKANAVDSHLTLLTHVGRSLVGVEGEVEKLRAMPPSPAVSGVIFRGYATIERLLRLKAELLGAVEPPTQNVYLTRIDALLSAQVDLGALPAVVRAQFNDPRSS